MSPKLLVHPNAARSSVHQHPWALEAEHRGWKWTPGPDRCGFIATPSLTCRVTLDLLFNCSKLWFSHPARADGNANPTGFLNGLRVIGHEQGLVHSGCLIIAG